MAAEGQTGSKMLDEMLEYRIFELLKKYHYTLRDRRDDCLNAYQCAGDLRIFYGGICHLFKRSEGEDDPCEAGDD
mgnify:CR=1 FL=1